MTESNNKVGIDAGLLLLVDPCAIPVEVLKVILRGNEHGYTAGVLMEVPGGDCTLEVTPGEVGPLEIESGMEPCWCEGVLDCELCEEFGVNEYARPWKVASQETVDTVLEAWAR